MAHVLDTQGNGGSIEQRFRNFLLYIAQSGLKDPISFPENSLPLGDLLRSCGHSRPGLRAPNNVTSRTVGGRAQGDRCRSRGSLGELPTSHAAENDNEVWKEIFGPRFKTED